VRILSGILPLLTALGLVATPLSLEAQTKKPTAASQRKPAKSSPSPQKKPAKPSSSKASTSKSSSSSKGSPPKSAPKGSAPSRKERGETVLRAVPLESEPSEPIVVEPPPPPPPPPMIDITHPDFRMPPRKGSPKPHGTRQDPPDRRRTRPLDEPNEIPLPGGGKSSLFALAQDDR